MGAQDAYVPPYSEPLKDLVNYTVTEIMLLQLNWIGPNNTDLIELTNPKSLLVS